MVRKSVIQPSFARPGGDCHAAQSRSDPSETTGYEATIRVLQNHAAGLVNDKCRVQSTQR